MTWQPEPRGLFQLLSLLRDAIRPNNRDQVLVQQRLSLFNDTPDYNSYLIYILVVMTQEDNYTRAIAGLTLKNNLLNHFNRIPLTVLDHVKYISLQSLDSPDPDATVRRTIGSVITAIIVRGQVLNWPKAIQDLAHHLESSNPVAVEVNNLK
ncbi:armadillo-type protein [Pilaira anomala]|nr:armadillo-type protein [Pilaira anomala]